MDNELNNQLQGLALANPQPLANRPNFHPVLGIAILHSGNTPGSPLSAIQLEEFLGEYHFEGRNIANITEELQRFNPQADANYFTDVIKQLRDLYQEVNGLKSLYKQPIQVETDRIFHLYDGLLKIAGEGIPRFDKRICIHSILTPTVTIAIEKAASEGPLNLEDLQNLLRGVLKLWIYICDGEFFCRVVDAQVEPFSDRQERPVLVNDSTGLIPLRNITNQFKRLHSLFATSKKHEKRDYDYILKSLVRGLKHLTKRYQYDISAFLN